MSERWRWDGVNGVLVGGPSPDDTLSLQEVDGYLNRLEADRAEAKILVGELAAALESRVAGRSDWSPQAVRALLTWVREWQG